VPLARVAAQGQLTRVTEDDLLFTSDEMTAFAAANGADATLLSSTGGWPALAELTVSAGADMVLDYLWEEILNRLGPARAQLLARFNLVGGGNDIVASVICGREATVDDIVASVPLVARAANGWSAVHPLWDPVLGALLGSDERSATLRDIADLHRAA